ncbi:MAG: GGDEF domain-containing protein [Cyanobium sp.]
MPRPRDDSRLVSWLGLLIEEHPSRRRPSPLHEIRWLVSRFHSLQTKAADLHTELVSSQSACRRLEAENNRLNRFDPQTGCVNRRELYRRLEQAIGLSIRERRPLSLLCLEIDHLRQLQAGDGETVAQEIVRRVAMEMRMRCRITDLLARLGDDQFALVLVSCDVLSAREVADSLCESITAVAFRDQDAVLRVTVSVGLASLREAGDDAESVISRAQSALYRAKAEGRNRVVVL